ncbi:putative alkylated DNA repair protein AlkB [Ancylostoma ceylanicum]|uniref:Putative alkylated DNA repair protein AlkB n=1 Tax=Ancylostoma ceylanicum TaxID=53326 RepID=A0A0D6LF54_9BILA|nr:putative alkylated DNA repair protein AlkB [Ancylostoma ceylanicum]
MSSNPRWWPYRIPIEEALKKSAVAIAGVIVGANVISYYWKPLQGDHYGSDSEEQPTVFKKMFKMYKRRNPAPDLSQLIESVADPRVEGKCGILNFQQLSSANVNEDELLQLGLKPLKNWKLVTLSGRQGLYIIPNAMREEAVEMWLSRSFKYAEPPNTTNLTAHGKSPEKDVLKIAGKSLRWTTLGVDYNWDTKEYPLTGDPLPPELVQFADVVTRVLGLGPMYADATIVNYYPPKSTLSPHVDRSERTDAPLVSLSLGQSAVYLTGGESLDDEVVPLWLRSGDVLVMHGAQRLVYHAVAAIHKTCVFDIKDPVLADFANTSRVNITIRQFIIM